MRSASVPWPSRHLPTKPGQLQLARRQSDAMPALRIPSLVDGQYAAGVRGQLGVRLPDPEAPPIKRRRIPGRRV